MNGFPRWGGRGNTAQMYKRAFWSDGNVWYSVWGVGYMNVSFNQDSLSCILKIKNILLYVSYILVKLIFKKICRDWTGNHLDMV